MLIDDAVQIMKQPVVVASTRYIDMPVDEPWKHQLEFTCAAKALTFFPVLPLYVNPTSMYLAATCVMLSVMVLLYMRGECGVGVVRI